MVKNETINNIDHFIQLDILKSLVGATHPLKFRDLHNPGIENSLFTYHLKKLINRQLIEKDSDGLYELTTKGAQVANWYSESLSTLEQPRNLVNLYVEHDNKVLLAKRTHAYSHLLNTYLFPGGLVKYGVSSDITANELIIASFGNKIEHEFMFTFEPIIHDQNGFTSHHIISFFRVKTVPLKLVDTERFIHEWFDVPQVPELDDFTKSPFIKDVIKLARSSNAVGHVSKEYRV